jgi:hypothetical protein
MKQFVIDCYEVSESDGGGMHSNHVAFVSSKTLADHLVAVGHGRRSAQPYKKVITVFDTLDEIEENSKANLRKSALAKLTVAEQQALGL